MPPSADKPATTPSPLHMFTAGPYRVNYSNTDRMGHAYHAEYLVWFECARTDLLRSLGATYRQWEDDEGIYLPVTRCSVEFHRPAQYDDLLTVETTITRLTRATIDFHYSLSREGTAELLATGTTSHAFTDCQGKIHRCADRLMPQFF